MPQLNYSGVRGPPLDRLGAYSVSAIKKAAFKLRLLEVDPREASAIVTRDAPPSIQGYGMRVVAIGPALIRKIRNRGGLDGQRESTLANQFDSPLYSPDRFTSLEIQREISRSSPGLSVYVSVWGDFHMVRFVFHEPSGNPVALMSSTTRQLVGKNRLSSIEWTYTSTKHAILSFEEHFNRAVSFEIYFDRVSGTEEHIPLHIIKSQ